MESHTNYEQVQLCAQKADLALALVLEGFNSLQQQLYSHSTLTESLERPILDLHPQQYPEPLASQDKFPPSLNPCCHRAFCPHVWPRWEWSHYVLSGGHSGWNREILSLGQQFTETNNSLIWALFFLLAHLSCLTTFLSGNLKILLHVITNILPWPGFSFYSNGCDRWAENNQVARCKKESQNEAFQTIRPPPSACWLPSSPMSTSTSSCHSTTPRSWMYYGSSENATQPSLKLQTIPEVCVEDLTHRVLHQTFPDSQPTEFI